MQSACGNIYTHAVCAVCVDNEVAKANNFQFSAVIAIIFDCHSEPFGSPPSTISAPIPVMNIENRS